MANLSLTEQNALARCERVITEHGPAAFVKVGLALMEIRDQRLYRLTHETFEDYCCARWGFKRAHAARLITAAGVATCLPLGDIANERQARAAVEDLAAEEGVAVAEAVEILKGASDAKKAQILAARVEKAEKRARQTISRSGHKDRQDQCIRLLDRAMRLAEGLTDVADELCDAIKAAIRLAESSQDGTPDEPVILAMGRRRGRA